MKIKKIRWLANKDCMFASLAYQHDMLKQTKEETISSRKEEIKRLKRVIIELNKEYEETIKNKDLMERIDFWDKKIKIKSKVRSSALRINELKKSIHSYCVGYNAEVDKIKKIASEHRQKYPPCPVQNSTWWSIEGNYRWTVVGYEDPTYTEPKDPIKDHAPILLGYKTVVVQLIASIDKPKDVGKTERVSTADWYKLMERV
jgi:hypothetical protein